MINDYASVVDGLREDIADLEDDVLKGSGRVTGRMTNRLYELSREVVRFQRVTEHLEAVLEALATPACRSPNRTWSSQSAWVALEAVPAG